jgi:hypothetical protein
MEVGFRGEWFSMTLEVQVAEPFGGWSVIEAFVAREYECGAVLFIPS